MRVIGADEIRAALPMSAAIDALETAFRDEVPSGAGPLRSTVGTPAGSLLLMPAAGERGVGVKLVTLTEANPAAGLPFVQAAYVLFDPATQSPVALLDGTALTALRTAAVSGLATRSMAVAEASRLVVVGAGTQARAHVEAMRAVRTLSDVAIVSRTPERAERLAAETGSRVGVPADLADADIICCCTTSTTPVLGLRDVGPGAHVNAVGAFEPSGREVGTDLVVTARVVVEHRSVALEEAGDVLIPIREQAIDESHIAADLSELVGGAPVRRGAADITLFVSVGMAFEDLVVAGAVLDALS